MSESISPSLLVPLSLQERNAVQTLIKNAKKLTIAEMIEMRNSRVRSPVHSQEMCVDENAYKIVKLATLGCAMAVSLGLMFLLFPRLPLPL